jgi:hypothetical protein
MAWGVWVDVRFQMRRKVRRSVGEVEASSVPRSTSLWVGLAALNAVSRPSVSTVNHLRPSAESTSRRTRPSPWPLHADGSRAAHHLAAELSAAAGEAVGHNPDQPFPLLREGLQQHAAELEAGVVDLRAFAADLASVKLKLGRFVTGGTANQALGMIRRVDALSADLAHPGPVRGLPAAIVVSRSAQVAYSPTCSRLEPKRPTRPWRIRL